MFERFTDPARHLVVGAQESSRSLNHDHIGTEHLLLALLDETGSVGATALSELGVDFASLRSRVVATVGRGNRPASGHIPFTPHAKKTLEMSLREALALRHNYIGTEHILLGLLRTDEGTAAEALRAAGVDLYRARQQVTAVLEREPAPAPRPAAGAGGTGAAGPGDADPDITAAREAKDAALDRGDFEAAAAFRSRERELLDRSGQQSVAEAGAGTPDPGTPGDAEDGGDAGAESV